MGYLSHRVHPDQIKPGDHIYTWRSAFTYSHHGIYVGGNMVIHFTAPETANFGSGWNLSSSIPSSCLNSVANSCSGVNLCSSTPSSCLNSVANSGSGWNLSSSTPSSCMNSIDSWPSQPKDGQSCDSGSCLNSIDGGLSQPESGQDCVSGVCFSTHYCEFKQSESGVMVSCLNCFIGTGSLYLYQYGVSKLAYVTKLRGGTCTIKASDPPEDVISRAIYLLHNGFGDYNVVKNNCEDFALYCKTGLLISGKHTTGGSGQVNFLCNAPWKTIAFSVALNYLCKSTYATVAVPVQTVWNRYTTDIGVRDDVVKVKVEDVGLFMASRNLGMS